MSNVSAEPIDPGHGRWQPDPVRQQLASHTIEDILNLPDDAPRVELLDGVMLVVPSPAVAHQSIASLLWLWLRQHAPAHLNAVQAVGVAVTPKNTYEPDVLLCLAETDDKRHYLVPHEVVLTVEVVSPGTRRRDRFDKPMAYAEAGIPFYWRVEQDPIHVHAYALDNGVYKAAGDSATELQLDQPFPIRLSIAEITP